MGSFEEKPEGLPRKYQSYKAVWCGSNRQVARAQCQHSRYMSPQVTRALMPIQENTIDKCHSWVAREHRTQEGLGGGRVHSERTHTQVYQSVLHPVNEPSQVLQGDLQS